MTTLAWKVNRLKLMGAPEIAWRVRQLLQKKASRFGIGLQHRPPAPASAAYGASFLQLDAPVDRQAVCGAADALLAGRWTVFALRDAPLGFPPRWNRDPRSGTEAPLTPGKSIDYRNPQLVGDIKYLWEPARHLELVTLAAAWRSSGQRRYADGARQLLESWFEQCPYPLGVHWSSSLELALRLLNWACAWHLLGGAASPLFEGDEGQRFLRRWLDAIFQHCHFIDGYFSRHSSANNHLFGEYMGLFIASLTWPCWRHSAAWRRRATIGLETEALKQNTADGVNREQAVYYQHEVMDMMLLCLLAGRANGVALSPAYVERLERMAQFLAALMDAGGNVPMIGDADDALMLRLSFEPGWSPYRSLLASCAVLYGRADFKSKAGHFDDKNRWLFGAAGEKAWQALVPPQVETPRMAFPEGGYFLLGHRFGAADEIRLVADCAPLGYLSIAAHGHADALALTLSAGGEELLIDPGTYAYHTQGAWRDYFRGTAAHNTVEVDGLDQSEIGGNFMWLRKASARLLRHDTAAPLQVWEGEHDGYQRLADPLVHRRRVELDTHRGDIVIKDILQCAGPHQVALHWHFAEDCRVEQGKGGLDIVARRVSMQMQCGLGDGSATLFYGSETPPAGWISRRFDVKTAIVTAVWRASINGYTEIVTRIALRARTS